MYAFTLNLQFSVSELGLSYKAQKLKISVGESANSVDPDEVAHKSHLIWIYTVCSLVFEFSCDIALTKYFFILQTLILLSAFSVYLRLSNYSRLSLSRLRLSRITAYLEEKIGSFFERRI